MDRHVIARVLEEIGTLMDLSGESPFRARAFFNAARAAESLEGDVAALAASGGLAKVKGFGPATAEVARELAASGTSSLHRELRARTPAGLLEVLRVPGLGARRIHALHEKLGITSLDELERAAAAGRIAALPGFGKKTEEKLLEGVAFLRSVAGRRRQPEAWLAAARAVEALASNPAVRRVEPSGALRRRMETVGAVALIAATDAVDRTVAAFLELPGAVRGEREGEADARAWTGDGLELRLCCAAPEAFAAAWLYGTGGDAHWAALVRRAAERELRLDRDGLWRGAARIGAEDEAALYTALGLAFIAPELREGQGEVEAAAEDALPRLLEAEDLRGCFHCHTTYSDGKATLQEMAEAAAARGWRYLGLADHSRAAAYAGGLSVDEIARQHEEIDRWNAERGHELWLFKGIEADILADGRLDYASEEGVLSRFDYVVGSVHSSFGLSEAEQTARVLRAVEDPHLTFLGHPTGRLLLSRRGYRIDVDAVIAAAAERGVGIEINANPWRLDLDWRLWRRAREAGVRTAINPDAHDTDGLDDVRWGVGVARKGWLTTADVVNAWEVDVVKAFFAEGRGR